MLKSASLPCIDAVLEVACIFLMVDTSLHTENLRVINLRFFTLCLTYRKWMYDASTAKRHRGTTLVGRPAHAIGGVTKREYEYECFAFDSFVECQKRL